MTRDIPATATKSGPRVLTGTRIRERRIGLGLRQADVARQAGISPAYLNLIEHNRRAINPAVLARLAGALLTSAAELEAGREESRIAILRAAAESAADPRSSPPELANVTEFAARFPGWADLLGTLARRVDTTEQRLIALSDRMTRDPYLVTTLHEVLSAVTAVRSTASILAEDGPLDEEWRRRFLANLDQDSLRLSTTAQALVAYLESFEGDHAPLSPQEEFEDWLAAGAQGDIGLASDAARQRAADYLRQLDQDRAQLSDDRLHQLITDGQTDPFVLAAQDGLPLALVLRRLAQYGRGAFVGAGLIVADGAGALVLRMAPRGMAMPRPGDTCPLWPVFEALAVPGNAVRRRIVMPDGQAYDCWAIAERLHPMGFDGPVLGRAQMLLRPALGPGDALPVGAACRICPRPECPARREPSITGAN